MKCTEFSLLTLNPWARYCFSIVLFVEKILKFVAFFVIALSVQSAFASLSFHHVGIDLGSIIDIEFDSQGVMWLASREGLYRYDGSRLQHISSEDGLSDDDIRSLTVDMSDNIWIATNSGGLNIFDPKTGSVQRFRQTSSLNSLSNDSVYDVAFVGKDRAWVSTQNGLNLFDIQSGTFTRYFHKATDPQSVSANYGYSLFVDDSQRVWVATLGGGVSVYNPEQDNFEQIWLSRYTTFKNSDGVFAVRQLSSELFLFATRTGLYRYHYVNKQLEPVTLSSEPGQELGTVTDLALDESKVFVSTLNDGVFVYDIQTASLSAANPSELGSRLQTPAVPIYSLALYESQLFIATLSKGLYSSRINYSDLDARLLRTDVMGDLTNITSVDIVDNGDPIFGSFGAGLMVTQGDESLVRMDQGSVQGISASRFQRLREQYPEITKVGILAVDFDTERNRLYLGTTVGLWAIDLNTEQLLKIARYRHTEIGYVNALHIDDKGDVWFGSGGLGLMLWSGKSQLLIGFNEHEMPNSGLSGDYVTTLQRDGRYLWVGTRSNGLSRCEIKPLKCEHLDSLSGSASHFNVTAIAKLSNGNIMFATRGGGVFELTNTSSSTSLHKVTEEQGLNSNIILAVEEDSDGSVWLATAKGLSRLNPRRDDVVNYPIDELVGTPQFNAHASAQNEDALFFGGLEGVIRINKHTKMPADVEHSLLLNAKVKQEDKTLKFTTDSSLSVGPRSIIELDFALLDYGVGTKEYEYRLSAHEAWQAIGATQQFLLHHLSAGSYQIQVRSRDFTGRWQYSKPLLVKVNPHWWQTPWFVVILVCGALVTMWWWHKMRTQRLHQRNQDLLRLQALKQQAKEQERRHISRELHDEIGQNLTACKLGLQMLNLQQQSPDLCAQVAGSVSLLDKIISQTRDLTQSLRPPMLDELGLFAALDRYFIELQKRTNTRLCVYLQPDLESSINHHGELAFRVIQEAVNNALKHANASTIEVSATRVREHLVLTVADNGVGIELKDIEQCIRSGKHLGLLGMRERLYQVKGDLIINAGRHQGCKIKARIPLQ